MDSKKAYKNWNHMYEYKFLGKWYPCHILNDPFPQNGYCSIYTANGSADTVPFDCVRKMNKRDYLKHRGECIEQLGNNFPVFRLGFHEDIEDDLRMYEQLDELRSFEKFYKKSCDKGNV